MSIDPKFDVEINKNGTIHIDYKDTACPSCGQPYGRRQVKKTRNGWAVHSTCLTNFEAELRQQEAAQRQREENEEREAAQAKRDEIRELRGDDIKIWIRVFEDALDQDIFPENERRLCWVMEQQLSKVKSYEADRQQFQDRLLESPGYALEWSISFFEQTAAYEVAQIVIDWWKGGLTYDQIIAQANKYALQEAASPTRSTSPTSNLYEQCKMKAYANVARYI